MDLETVTQAVRTSLTPELLNKEWARVVGKNAHPVAGHCAKASEAFYNIVGGKAAGYLPFVCKYYLDKNTQRYFADEPHCTSHFRATHWWIQGPLNAQRGKGHIHDMTVRQYKTPFPYEHGKGCGFQQPQKIPSQIAQIIIDRVEEKLGPSEIKAFRQKQIEQYQKALNDLCSNRPVHQM